MIYILGNYEWTSQLDVFKKIILVWIMNLQLEKRFSMIAHLTL